MEVLSGEAGIASDAPQSGLQATKLWLQLAPSHLASHYLPASRPSILPQARSWVKPLPRIVIRRLWLRWPGCLAD